MIIDFRYICIKIKTYDGDGTRVLSAARVPLVLAVAVASFSGPFV